MRRRLRIALVGTAVALLALGGGAAFLYTGIYNVAATEPHVESMQWLLETAMRQSVRRRARDIEVPRLTDPAMITRGRALHDAYCVRCHGAPGIAPEGDALGLMPAPANLAYTAREWTPPQIFWAVKNGIRMTGMPAWRYRLGDDDLWAIVAYLRVLPFQSPAEYRASAPVTPDDGRPTQGARDADAERGKRAIHQYACATCHVIPGITGAQTTVGPPLTHIARRGLLAGMIPNTPDNMVRWLQAPQAIYPDGAMPDLGVTPGDARDMAAYLATLK